MATTKITWEQVKDRVLSTSQATGLPVHHMMGMSPEEFTNLVIGPEPDECVPMRPIDSKDFFNDNAFDDVLKNIHAIYETFTYSASPVVKHIDDPVYANDAEKDAYVNKMLKDLGIDLGPDCRMLSAESKVDIMDVTPIGGMASFKMPASNITLSIAVGNYKFNTIEYHEYTIDEDDSGIKTAILVNKTVDISNSPLPGPQPAVPAPRTYNDWVTGNLNDLYHPQGLYSFALVNPGMGNICFRVAGPIKPSIKLVMMCNMIADLKIEKFIKYRWNDQFTDNMNKAKTFPLVNNRFIDHLNDMIKDDVSFDFVDINKWLEK